MLLFLAQVSRQSLSYGYKLESLVTTMSAGSLCLTDMSNFKNVLSVQLLNQERNPENAQL